MVMVAVLRNREEGSDGNFMNWSSRSLLIGFLRLEWERWCLPVRQPAMGLNLPDDCPTMPQARFRGRKASRAAGNGLSLQSTEGGYAPPWRSG
jgi:hypothetical protein